MRNVVEIDPKYIKWGLPIWTSTLVDVDLVRQLATKKDDLLSIRLFDLVHSAHCAANTDENMSHILVMDTTSNLDMMMADSTTKPAVGYSAFYQTDIHHGQDNLVILAVPPSDVCPTELRKWRDIHKEVLKGGKSLAKKTRQKYSRFNELASSDTRDITPADLLSIVGTHKKLGGHSELVDGTVLIIKI